ncbi:ExbD/TolR family protein [Sphingomonas sp. GlSt437]|uniref:ExbD/TolR family protein n=1 Tax=Sphingomonas sp. GlSt437 TaxID=3389970 RepID=UPI003A8C4E69
MPHATARSRFAYAPPADLGQPISGINTTPLIDVMLVLLVMFIIIIPVAQHEIPVPLPQAGPVPKAEQQIHELRIDAAGRVTLDGATLAGAALSGRLTALARDPRAELRIHTDATTRYEAFADTLATVKRAGITRLGFEGSATGF